jgi:DNA repair protein RadD
VSLAVHRELLRPYQRAGYDEVCQALTHVRRVLIALPTGGGKTVLAAHVVLAAYLRGERVIFFAHRRELIAQTRRKLIDAGIPDAAIGILMASDPHENTAAPVQVASIDTWRHRDPPPADLVIIDEAHRSLSQSYLDVVAHYEGAVVVGLTATPYRADGGGLGLVYEHLVVVALPSQLIADGHLVEPRVFSATEKPDLSGVRVRGGEFHEGDLADAMQRGALVGNIVQHWQQHARELLTVAFAVSVAHSQAIAAAFVEHGIAAEHLDGATLTRERDAILGRLESGETRVVTNCGVLCEGWDQPSVKCAILARPTMSVGLYLQQAGRILRPYQGQQAIILDHAGNALRHGLPQDDRTFSLDTAAAKKGKASAPTKECPSCNAVLPLGTRECTVCGHVFQAREAPPVDAAGELVEIDLAQRAYHIEQWDRLCRKWALRCETRIAMGQRPPKPGVIYHRFRELYGCAPPTSCKLPLEIAAPAEKDAAYSELLSEAETRGYKAGWAAYRFKSRFGHWPARKQVSA